MPLHWGLVLISCLVACAAPREATVEEAVFPAEGAQPGQEASLTAPDAVPAEGVLLLDQGAGRTLRIRIPESVRTRWRGAELQIEDRSSGEQHPLFLDVGDAKPWHDLEIELLGVLPDFVQDQEGVTSRTAAANNPAAVVRIGAVGEQPMERILFLAHPQSSNVTVQRYRIVARDLIAK